MPDVKLVLATSVKDKGGTVSEDIKDPISYPGRTPNISLIMIWVC